MAWRIQSTVEATKSSDALYHLYFTTLQSHLEIWLGIIAASLPTLAPIASKVIIPAFSRLRSSHRKFVTSSGYFKKANRAVGGSGGDIPLQNTGFTRLEESLVGSSDAQHWRMAEGTNTEANAENDVDSDGWRGRPDAITVELGYDVFAEPRQQV